MKKAMDELKSASRNRSPSKREEGGREGGSVLPAPTFVFLLPLEEEGEEAREEAREEGASRQKAAEGAEAKSVAAKLRAMRQFNQCSAVALSLPPSLPPPLPT